MIRFLFIPQYSLFKEMLRDCLEKSQVCGFSKRKDTMNCKNLVEGDASQRENRG